VQPLGTRKERDFPQLLVSLLRVNGAVFLQVDSSQVNSAEIPDRPSSGTNLVPHTQLISNLTSISEITTAMIPIS
jgi:hypothetical protein